MIPTEILTFGVSTALGGWLKLKGKDMEWRQQVLQMSLQKHEAVEASHAAAAKRGGNVMRRIIVKAVMFSIFVAPFLLILLGYDVPIYYAYVEEQGRWFFGLIGPPMDKLKYVKLEGYVILPVMTQMASAIGGFYFGSSTIK